MAAGALGSVLVCPRSSGAATDADAGAVAEALLVVASVAVADREFNPEKLLTACPPGVSITKVPTFVQVVNESLLSPRLALRPDACDCLAVVVAASSSSPPRRRRRSHRWRVSSGTKSPSTSLSFFAIYPEPERLKKGSIVTVDPAPDTRAGSPRACPRGRTETSPRERRSRRSARWRGARPGCLTPGSSTAPIPSLRF